MQKALGDNNPTLSYNLIEILNDILAFADDTLVFADSILDIRRAIDRISIEI